MGFWELGAGRHLTADSTKTSKSNSASSLSRKQGQSPSRNRIEALSAMVVGVKKETLTGSRAQEPAHPTRELSDRNRLPGSRALIGDEAGASSSTAERRKTSSNMAEGAVTGGTRLNVKASRFPAPVSGLVVVVVGHLMESVTGRDSGRCWFGAGGCGRRVGLCRVDGCTWRVEGALRQDPGESVSKGFQQVGIVHALRLNVLGQSCLLRVGVALYFCQSSFEGVSWRGGRNSSILAWRARFLSDSLLICNQS